MTYDQTWNSVGRHHIPEWFHDETFGIYFHWGPYSVPAYGNEWYPREMYREGTDVHEHHVETYGDPAEYGYHEFIPDFHGEAFDADEWATLCAEAGADYVGITAIHHDGFALWDSDLTAWNAVEMGPERDIVGELAEAVRDRDMKFLAAFHHAANWWYYPRDEAYHTMDPDYAGLYGPPHEEGDEPPESYVERWRDLTVEVIDDYRPDLLWFDFGWGSDPFLAHDEYRRDVVAHYYNCAEEWGKEVDICHKEQLPPGVGIVDHERMRAEDVTLQPWLTDTSIDRASWGYIENSDFKSVETMVTGFVDRVSKNGNTLLNVGPKPDGTIPEGALERLRAFGDWLETNREAMSGTRPGWTFGEGPTDVTSGEFEEATSVAFTGEDVRFLRGTDEVYVVLLDWPDDGLVEVETSPRQLLSVSGHRQSRDTDASIVGAPDVDVALDVAETENGGWWPPEYDDAQTSVLQLELPADPPNGLDHAYVIRLEGSQE
ncbi:alpha-L-fucosidase [Halobacteria archaeon AArc-m2/3/4]|uniref:alpha-L-fucosidase n=1 Tax=Natronoglomus mannanivorans TaxID=2979990 RepID=A0ABT2QGU2_9EURY|nr:alpha-L-fucosidase [Halobacteria archaeon AArc-m2/3/4]